jgi:hypothetical protein
MPMDEDEFKEQYIEQEKRNDQLIETDHAAARFAQNPETALEAMQEERDGYAFTAQEVLEYMTDLSKEGRDIPEGGTAPIDHTLDLDRNDVLSYGPTVMENLLESAVDGEEEYAELSDDNADINASAFAYIGDENL